MSSCSIWSSLPRTVVNTIATLCLLLPIGCTTASPHWNIIPENVTSCVELWHDMEQSFSNNDIYDVASARVGGYPFLRSNRFYAAAASQFEHPEQQRQIVHQLQQLDLEGRYRELNRLPSSEQQRLSQRWAGAPSLGALKAKISRCSSTFLRQTFNQENFYQPLTQALPIADDYSTWQRTVGIYPLASWLVSSSAHRAHLKIQQRVQAYDPTRQIQSSITYSPQVRRPLSHKAMRAILKSTRDNWISTSLLSSADMQRIAHSWAPTLRQFIDPENDTNNLIGRVRRDNGTITVDSQQPTVYYYTSHTLLQGQPTVQINYVFWYASNHSKKIQWWARGNMDGFTLRYTLTRTGELAMVDLIKNCGCYHGFVPNDALFDIENLKQPERRAQILQQLPQYEERQRLEVALSDSHQILHVSAADKNVPAQQSYLLRPYNDLEQLVDEEGHTGSLFNSQGIVPNTTRPEAAMLYSMGIKSVGSMRQRGHQPITLIGREHFDNPHLFDQIFYYLQPPTKAAHYLRRSSSGLSKRVNSLKQMTQQPSPGKRLLP